MEPERHHRYRLPDHVKERQAADLRKRFSAYSGGQPKLRLQAVSARATRRAAGSVLRVLLVGVLAYAVWRYWR